MAEPEILTVEEIIAAGEREFEIPSLPGKKIRIRKISWPEYRMLLPADPPESLTWPDVDEGMTPEQKEEARAARRRAEIAWLESLSDDLLERRRQGFAEIDYRLVALAAVSPRLTVEDARRLGNDAAIIATHLLAFSIPRKPDAA